MKNLKTDVESKNIEVKKSLTTIVDSQVLSKKNIFTDKSKVCEQNILPVNLLQTSATNSIINGKDREKFWNNSCKLISEKLWFPTKINNVYSNTISSVDFLDNKIQNSSQMIIPRLNPNHKNVQKSSLQSWGFSASDIKEQENIITRKIRIYPPQEMKDKLIPMFDCSKYFYNKTVNFLINTYFANHTKFIFDRFLETEFDYKEEYNLTNESIELVASKISLTKRIYVKFNKIKIYSEKFKLLSNQKIRNFVLPTNMEDTHVEYWTSETPHHVKETSCFEAYTNYKTAITNYMCKLFCNFLSYTRLSKTNKNLKFIIDEFSLKQKTDVTFIGIKNKSLKFKENTFMVRCMKNLTYKINKKEKSRCLKLINGDIKKISDSKLILINGEYYLCLVLNVKTKQTDPKFNIVSLDPGVRTFQTIYSPEGVTAKLGNAHNQLLVKLSERIDKYQSYKDKTKIPFPLLLTEEQRINSKKNRRKRYKLKKHMAKSWKRIKNIVDQLHKSTAKYLTDNFKHILLPETNISNMVKSYKRKINKTTVRGLLCLSHFKFRERLKQLAKRTGNNVIEVSEAYTSKTCGSCGYMDENLGGKKTFECSCGYKCDRDIHGARNIYIRAINNIWDRSIPLVETSESLGYL